jgi:hypothetical protein
MSEGPRKWSEVSDKEANQYRRNPAQRVAAPGAALIAVGCLGIVANFLLALGLSAVMQNGGGGRPARGDGR